MKRTILAACAALMLVTAGCDGINSAGSSPPPTSPPVETTPALPAATDFAIRQAFSALETTTQLIDLAITFKAITPGSATALMIADRLDQTRNLLNKASAAERLGNMVLASQHYAVALDRYADAQRAIATITGKGAVR